MGLPLQAIKESRKNADWAKQCIASIDKIAEGTDYLKRKRQQRFCRDFYDGIFDKTETNYLTKIDEYDLPAEIRFIPIVRPKLNLLQSQEITRPFNWHIYACDERSIDAKVSARDRMIMGIIQDKMVQKHDAMQAIINLQKQIQAEQREPTREEIEQLNQLNQAASIQIGVTPDEIKEVDKYIFKNPTNATEYKVSTKIKDILKKQNVQMIFNNGFLSKMINDEEIYYVDVTDDYNEPVVKQVDEISLFYSIDDDVQYLEDAEWIRWDQYLNYAQIIDMFGSEITDLELNGLQKELGIHDGTDYFPNDNYGVGNPNDGQYGSFSRSFAYSKKIRVSRYFWRSVREVKFKESQNKYDAKNPFVHYYDETDDKPLGPGERIIKRYVNDIWEGYKIGDRLYKRMQKRPVQVRNLSNPTKSYMPFVGYMYSQSKPKPYSLIWATKDIQKLYNIINYHEELMIALSGAKGFIMDKSQLPNGMTPKEWQYQRKLGTAWIQSVKDGKQISQFNQFQQYDDTIPASIMHLKELKMHLEEMVSQITGVSRQRMGNIVQTDQVGTAQQAMMQSSLITEVLHYQHQQLKIRTVQRLANCLRYTERNGSKGQYITNELESVVYEIHPGELDTSEFEIYASDGSKDEKALQDLKFVLSQNHAKGAITLSQFVELYNVEDLILLSTKIEDLEKKAMQVRQMEMSNQSDSELEKEKLLKEMDIEIERQRLQIEAKRIQIEEARLQLEKYKVDMEMQGKKYQVDVNAQTDMANIESTENVDMAYLKQQVVEARDDKELAYAELAIKGDQGQSRIAGKINNNERKD